MGKREHNLSNRDIRILEFIARYRIGTSRLVRDSCFGGSTRLKNVDRVLLRLERRGLLKRSPLDVGMAYHTITRRGLSMLTDNPRTPRPLSEQTLPIALAIASYCVAHGIERLTRREFEADYPELSGRGVRSSSYTLNDSNGVDKLEMLVVDRGGAAHRIRSRVRRILAQRKRLPRFWQLMEAGRFRITVLTATRGQKQKILRRVGGGQFDPVEVTAVVMPQLADILMVRKRNV